MKKPSLQRRRSGFTLIELLVVITIVAALAALSFAGVNSALKKAKITQGKVAASNVVQAVNNYYSEYGRLPEFASAELRTDEEQGVRLLRILLAEEDTEEDNPRGINFLSVQEGKGRRGGLYYGSGENAQVEGLYDPFGQPYTVVLNIEYEDRLTFQMGGKAYNLRGEQVAVYSAGPDLETGTTDDITSFQR